MKEKKNCHEYCRFSRYCYAKGEPGLDPDDCPTAWKIEDILNDAKDIEEELKEPEDPDDWEE